MLVRELKDKGATIAWSPVAKEPNLLALASKEGGGAGFDDYGGELQITRLELGNRVDRVAATIKTSGRFSSLTWGAAATCGLNPALGLLAGGMSDGVVNVWNPETVLAAASSGAAIPLDAEDNGFLCKIPGHEGPVRAIEFNPTPNAGHLIATGASDSKVFVVNLQNPGSPSVAAPDVLGHSVEPPREITSVAWNSQVAHILATATQSGSCLVWDLRTNKPWCQLKDASRSPFSSVSWNPIDGLYIVTATDDDINPLLRLWDLRSNTSTPLAELRGHSKGILSTSWCLQDPTFLVSCGKDNHTFVWDMQLGQMLYDFPQPASASKQQPQMNGYGGGYGDGYGAASMFGGAVGGGAESLFGVAPSANIGSGAGRRYEVKWSPKLPGILASCSFDRSVSIHSMVAMPGPDPAQTASQFVNPAAATRAPRWLKRPCSASFGFGGKLVVVTRGGALATSTPGQPPRRGVSLSIVSTPVDATVVTAAQTLEAKLTEGNLPSYCEAKVASASSSSLPFAGNDKAIWAFMRVIMDASQRHSLLEHLGHSADAIRAEIDTYASSHGVGTMTPGSPQQAPVANGKASVHEEPLVQSAEELFGAPTAPPAEPPAHTSSFSEPPAIMSPQHPPPPATNNDKLKDALLLSAAREVAMSPPVGHTLDPLGSSLLRRALLVGDFAAAVKCCFAQNRLADALLLAACGNEDLWKSAQAEYFKRSPSRFSHMVDCIVRMDLAALVAGHPLEDWKETLAMLATYAKTEQFTPLCEALGDRLKAAIGSVAFDAAEAATLCYMCAFNPVKAIGQFLGQIPQRSSVVGHALALYDFVEKSVVLRAAVEASGDAGTPSGATTDDNFPEAGAVAAFASVLANAGALPQANSVANMVRLPEAVVTAGGGSGVEELLALRHRLYVAGGYDPAYAPQLKLHHIPVMPSPEVTGVYAAPAAYTADAAQGYATADPSQAGYYDATYGQSYAPAPAVGYSGYAPAPAPAPSYGYTPAPAPAAPTTTSYGYVPAPAPVPVPVPAPVPSYGYTPAPAPVAGGYGYTPTPMAPAPIAAPAGLAAPPPIEKKSLPADGFVSSAGDPALGQKYGNFGSPLPAAAPVAAVPAPVPMPAPVAITPEIQAILDTLLSLAGHLETVGITPPERKMIGDARKSIAMLEDRLKAGVVSASTIARLQELTGACALYDFRTANSHQTTMANFDWNEHKDWLKGLKHLISIGLKKYPYPATTHAPRPLRPGIAESDTNGFGMERTSSAPPVQAGPMAFATTVRPFKLSASASEFKSSAPLPAPAPAPAVPLPIPSPAVPHEHTPAPVPPAPHHHHTPSHPPQHNYQPRPRHQGGHHHGGAPFYPQGPSSGFPPPFYPSGAPQYGGYYAPGIPQPGQQAFVAVMAPAIPGGHYPRPGFIPTQPMPIAVHTSPAMVPASPGTLVPAIPGSMPPPITLQPQPTPALAPPVPVPQRVSRRLEIRDPKTGEVRLKGWGGSGTEAPAASTPAQPVVAQPSSGAPTSAPSFVPAVKVSQPAAVDTEPFPDEIESETDEEAAREAEVAKFAATIAEMRKIAKEVSYKEWPAFLAKFTLLSGEKESSGRGGRGHSGRFGDRDRGDRDGDSDGKVTFPRPLDFEDPPKRFERVKRELGHDDAVIAKLRSHLGKLSPDTEASLVEKIRDLDVNSIALLERVVELVFDTALSNKFFQDLYAALCKKLGHSDLWVDNFVRTGSRDGKFYYDITGEIAKGASPDTFEWQGSGYDDEEAAFEAGCKQAAFRRLLLNRCQTEFNAYDESMRDDGRELSEEQRMDKESRQNLQKHRILSLFSFIGELYNIQMLTGQIMKFCLDKLLEGSTDSTIEEEKLEVFCQLLNKIGKQLETECVSTKIEGVFYTYLQRLQKFSVSDSLSSRMKFACLDVLDAKKAGWPSEHPNKYLKADDFRKMEEDKEARSNARRDRRGGAAHYGASGGDRRGDRRGDRDRERERDQRGSRPSALSRPSSSANLGGRRGDKGSAPSPRSPKVRTPREDGRSSGGLSRPASGANWMSNRTSGGAAQHTGQPISITLAANSGAPDEEPLDVIEDDESDEEGEVVPTPAKAAGPVLTGDKLMSRVRSMLSDYDGSPSSLNDLAEDLEGIRSSPDVALTFANVCFACVDSDAKVPSYASALTAMLNGDIESVTLTPEVFIQALSSVFAKLADLVQDAPKLPVFLGRLLADVLLNSTKVPSAEIGALAAANPGRPSARLIAVIYNSVLKTGDESCRDVLKGLPLVPCILPSGGGSATAAVIKDFNDGLLADVCASLYPQLPAAVTFARAVNSAEVDDLLDAHVASGDLVGDANYTRLIVSELLSAKAFDAGCDPKALASDLAPYSRFCVRVISDLASPGAVDFVLQGVVNTIKDAVFNQGWEEAELKAAVKSFLEASGAVTGDVLAKYLA